MYIRCYCNFLAVIVALWKIKLNNFKKVKLHFSIKTICDKNNVRRYDILELLVANTGNRKLILTSFGYSLCKGIEINILSEEPNFEIEFPVEIDIEKSILKSLYIN